MALLPGDVELFPKVSLGGDGEELTVIGFQGVEAVVVTDKTVEDAVRAQNPLSRDRRPGDSEGIELKLAMAVPGTRFDVDAGQ